MSETQAFSILSILCDRLLPGYYSTTMYGTLLDQKVFESLVERTMPILWEHLLKYDVQLSVVSLPWFLSLYINSMPLNFAFRVLDLFFLEGPKVLFQIGLAILRINGEELLDIKDDGSFISVLKNYFASLDQSAHPRSENKKLRAVTKFQDLMVVALKEFAGITQAAIAEQRAKYKDGVLDSIESFAKRTAIRNLGPDSKRLNMDDLGYIYDRFYSVLYEQERQMQQFRDSRNNYGAHKATEMVTGISPEVEMSRVGLGKTPEYMNYDGFRHMLASMTRWAVSDSPADGLENPAVQRRPDQTARKKQEPADHDFMQRLYGKWNKDDSDGLSLGNVVSGLGDIKGSRDLMGTIAYFFDLYDDDKDGKVNREGILRISEALLFLSRRGLEGEFTLIASAPDGLDQSLREQLSPNSITVHGSTLSEKFLNSVSEFIRRCFEYADPDHPQNRDDADGTASKLNRFSIGDDEEDLVDLSEGGNDKKDEKPADSANPADHQVPKAQARESANVALDPANPLHITLPTFRMVILADELLQQFFEFSFAESFHIAPPSISRSSSSFSIQTPTLTTFSNIGARLPAQPGAGGTSTAAPAPGPGGLSGAAMGLGGAAVASSKGLRGLLDNIVSDGMRVATEVKKRVDEAQRELEKNALQHEDEDDEDEESKTAGLFGPSAERARDEDHDLLDGGDIGSVREQEGIVEPVGTGAVHMAGATEGKNLLDEP
jgi:TBC1 domain family member 8/9